MTPRLTEPIGLSRDPYWDDAWVDKGRNEYVLPHPDNPLVELRAGRASELGKAISNTFSLNRWHLEQLLKGVLIRKSILPRAALTLNEGNGWRKAFWALIQEAQDVAGSKEPAALGTALHEFTELWDARKISLDEVPEPWDRDLLAYAELLLRTGIQAVPEFTERIVYNRSLNKAGRFDRLWRYLRCCDRWHVGDLKTGRSLDYGWHEIVVQLLVYATAELMFSATQTDIRRVNAGDSLPDIPSGRVWESGSFEWVSMPEVCTERGLVLHVPANGKVDEDGEPTGSRLAALFEVDLTAQIEVPFVGAGVAVYPTMLSPAELALAVQRWQKVKPRHLAKLVSRVEVTEDGEVLDSPLSVSERIDLCESRDEIEALWADSKAQGLWHGGHTVRARERIAGLS